jgi:hypothetical protein
LDGLSNLKTITGSIEIQYVSPTVDLSGLNNLDSVGGCIRITDSNIKHLDGFENLTYVGCIALGAPPIYPDPYPFYTSLKDLNGLKNLRTINSWFRILYSDSLISLQGLKNLDTIGGDFVLQDNASLTTLAGLDSVKYIGGDVEIIHNSALSECSINSICKYLDDNFANATIHGNSEGCNSPAEVDTACNSLSIRKSIDRSSVKITPNPVQSLVTISYVKNNTASVAIEIKNLNGLKIAEYNDLSPAHKEQKYHLNLENLNAGIYFCILKTSEEVIIKKIIKL